MDANGSSCLATKPLQGSDIVGLPATDDNSKDSALETEFETQAHVDSTPSAALEFSEKSSTSGIHGGTDCRKKERRTNILAGSKYRRQLRRSGSTVSNAWDALLDTFSQCYFTLTRDERGCHALSPPLPDRTVEAGITRRNAVCAHGISKAITFYSEDTSRSLISGKGERITQCFLPGTGEGEKTHALIRSTAATAAVGGLDPRNSYVDVGCFSLAQVGIPASTNPYQVALCEDSKGVAPDRCLVSTSAAAEAAYAPHQAIAVYNTVTSGHGKHSGALSSEEWLRRMGAEDSSKPRKGMVSDANVLDRLTRHTISDLQRQFAERNGAVSAAEFVYIFRQLFRRHKEQSNASVAAAGAATEGAWEGANAHQSVDTTATTAFEQEEQDRSPPLCGKVARNERISETASASIPEGTTESIASISVGHHFQDDWTAEKVVVLQHEEAETELSLSAITFDSLRSANPGQEPLWQQRQQDKELLEMRQLLDVFGLIDVNDNNKVTWEQFTRFIIDRGRNEDFLKRMHLQRLEGREMKETRLHLSPVESLTVAYDPPLSLDLVFYFEENSKTVEVLTPDHYPCFAPEQPAIHVPREASPLALSAFPKGDVISASFATAALSANSDRVATDDKAPGTVASSPTSYPFSSNHMLRDSVVQQRIPFVFPIHHSFTITAIAYCASVQHLAVAAADLSLSFYNIRQAGVSGCRQSLPTGTVGYQSPVNAPSWVSLSADSADSRYGGMLNGEEGGQWKATCSFRTCTCQIILYPSPGRPLLFSADHEGSIYAWDLLSICRVGSATSATDQASHSWHSPTEGRRAEQAASMPTGGNANTSSSVPSAANCAPRRFSLSVSHEATSGGHMPLLKSRRNAMRFDADVTAPAAIDLGTLTFNRSKQLSNKLDSGSETPVICGSATAGGRDRRKARRAIPLASCGLLPSGGSAVQSALSLAKEKGGAPVPNVPPLRFPANLQAGHEETHKTSNINDGTQIMPLQNKSLIRQRTDGNSAADRLDSSRTDHTCCDAPSSNKYSNNGRSSCSASRSTGSLDVKGRPQLHEYQSQSGRRHHSGLRASSEARLRTRDVKAGVDSPHGRPEDTSAINSSSRVSGTSVSTRGLMKCVSSCSLPSQKNLQGVYIQQGELQFEQQRQWQRDFQSCGAASVEAMPVSPTSSSYTPSTVSALPTTGSRSGGRSHSLCPGIVHKQLTRFNDLDSFIAVSNNSKDTRYESCAIGATSLEINSTCGGVNQVAPFGGSQQDTTTPAVGINAENDTQSSVESRSGPFERLRRNRFRAGTKLQGMVHPNSTIKHKQRIARSRGPSEAEDVTVQEEPSRIHSSVGAPTTKKSGVEEVDRPRMMGKNLDGSGWKERLRLQQQLLTAGEQRVCLSKEGRSGSDNRTTIGGLGPCIAFNGRLGAAQNFPSEPHSHLLHWRQLHAHSDIVSGFQELEGGTDMLASCGMDKRIILWSASTGEQKRVLDGHVRGIRALCFDVESRALLSGGFDYKLFVWNPYVGKKVHTIRGHSAPVVSICMLTGGGSSKRQFVSCDSEGIVKTWDLSSSACLQTLLAEDILPASGGQLRALVALPHRRMLLAAAGRNFVALVYGAPPENASASNSSKQPSNQHRSRGQCKDTTTPNGCGSAYSDTGSTTGVGGNAKITENVCGKIARNASSGDGVTRLQKVRTQVSTNGGSKGGAARGVANWSGMGAVKRKATVPALMGRHQDNGKFTGVADICKGLPKEGEPLTKAVAHAGVRVLVTAGATHLRVWDLCTGVLISSITHDCSGCSNRIFRRKRSDASSMCTAGNMLSSKSNSEVGTDGRRATQNKVSTGQRANRSQPLCHAAEGGRSSSGFTIQADSGRSGKAIRKEDGLCVSKMIQKSEAEDGHVITDICLDRSGRKVFVADHFGCLCAYSVCTGQMVRRLAAHAAEISHLVYAPEDRNLISVSWDRSIIVHNDAPSSVGAATAASLPSGTGVTASFDRLAPQDKTQSKQRQESEGHMAGLRRLLETGDDGSASNQAGMASPLMRAQTQPPIVELTVKTGGYNVGVVAPSANHSGYRGLGPPGFSSSHGDSTNGVWKTHGSCVKEDREDETSKIWRRVDNAHLGDVTCCAYSRRLGLLATGGVDKAIFIWNYERLRRIACLFGHREDVAILAFAEPLPFLCSADLSGTICIWVLPPHPHAARVLEAQSVALSCYGKIPLSLLTTTEASPANQHGSRMSPVQLQTSPAVAPTGGAYDGLHKQRDSYPTSKESLPTDRSTRDSQLNCNVFQGKPPPSDGIDNGKSQKRTSATYDVGDEEPYITQSRAAATCAQVFQQPSSATSNSAVPVRKISPATSQRKRRVSALGAACHTPPRSRPSSASVSFRLDAEHSVLEAGAPFVAGGTRKDLVGESAPEISESKKTVLRENNNLRSLVPIVGADAAREGVVPPTLLLVVIEDMEDITGSVPIVSLAALCKRRRNVHKENLLALPPIPPRALPLPQHPQEPNQQLPSATGEFSHLLLRATTSQAARTAEEDLSQAYTKKSTTFLTSSDASEVSLYHKASCANPPARAETRSSTRITRGRACESSGSKIFSSAAKLQREQNSHRRPSRKKSRSTTEVSLRLQLQQEEAAAAAARDTRWPQEAEFFLFAGDELGRVRVWDVSFLLQQLEGTRYIRKKTNWNPYRIWREELKESTFNIFRERVQQQQHQQQYLTRIVEQEEEAEEEMHIRRGASTLSGSRPTSPGATPNNLRAVMPPGRVNGRLAADAHLPNTDKYFTSSTQKRMQQNTHVAAPVVKGDYCNTISEGEESSGTGAKHTRRSGASPPTKTVVMNSAHTTNNSSGPRSAVEAVWEQDDKQTKKNEIHTRGGERLSSANSDGETERSSPSASLVASTRQQPGTKPGPCRPETFLPRRGVSFVEAEEESSKRGIPQQHQSESQANDSRFSPTLRHPKRTVMTSVKLPEFAPGQKDEVANNPAAEERTSEQQHFSAPIRASGTGKASPNSHPRTLLEIRGFSGGTPEGDRESMKRLERGNNYLREGKGTRASTETAFSQLLHVREATPLFLRAPVRLIASWRAHRDGVKSMQLLPIRSKCARRSRAPASPSITAPGAPTRSTKKISAGEALRQQRATGVSENCEHGMMNKPSENCFTKAGRKTRGRKRLLLLTAGGDGAARVWDVSGLSSEVTIPALFVDIATAAYSTKRNTSFMRSQLSPAAVWPSPDAYEGLSEKTDSIAFASSAANVPTNSFGTPTTCAAFLSRYGLPGSLAAAGNSLLLHHHQDKMHPLSAFIPSIGSTSPRSQIFLVGDLHAQSSNAVAAASGETHAARAAAAARGLQLPQPRRLWLLDLDREEEIENANSGGYTSSHAGEEEASSSDGSVTEDKHPSQNMQLVELHTRIKEMELEQQQLRAKRAEMRAEPSLLLCPLLPCLLPDDADLFSNNDNSNSNIPLALTDRRASSSSTHSSSSSRAC